MNIDRDNHDMNIDRDDDDDVELYKIPHFGLGLRVSDDGILFTPIEPDTDEDEDNDNDSNNGAEAFEIPHIGVKMRVNANTISLSRIQGMDTVVSLNDEQMDDN